MPTAPSSTDPIPMATAPMPPTRPGRIRAARRAVEDVGILFRFRAQAVRRRHLSRGLAATFVLVTLAVATVPAFMPGANGPGKAFDVFLLLPSAMAGILALNIASAVASGGGRELLSRDQASPYPISPTTDHLGALLLAPFNIAWMIQAWVLFGSMAYSYAGNKLFQAQVAMLLWLVFCTTLGQVVAWTMEAVRRGPYGIGITRGLLICLALGAGAVQLTGHAAEALDRIPTVWVFQGAVSGWAPRWWTLLALLLVASLLAIATGAVPTHLAARRMPRDEARMETDQHEPRAMPRTVIGLLIRADRASVWRSVPMRRGVLVLAVGPGLVAIFGDLPWSSMTILPGLVASGGALLFGVNAWCLDGRGALWRENLPVPASALFDARAWVLTEFLGVASLITIGLGALRAGHPGPRGGVRPRVHAAGGAAPGRGRLDALVAGAPLPGRPPLRAGDAGPAGGHGRLLRPAGHLYDVHEPDLLRRRARARLAALGAARDPVPALVGGPVRAHGAPLAGPGRAGARRDHHRCVIPGPRPRSRRRRPH